LQRRRLAARPRRGDEQIATILQSTDRRGYIGKPTGVGYFNGRGMLTGPDGSASLERSASSSETPNSAWNSGR
jgi:hypothetical protein